MKSGSDKSETVTKPEAQGTLAATTCSVERIGREVIEHKLLTALGDGNTVAILATKQNLEDMISALEYEWPEDDRLGRNKDLAAGMRQLLSEAFPPNVLAHRSRACNA